MDRTTCNGGNEVGLTKIFGLAESFAEILVQVGGERHGWNVARTPNSLVILSSFCHRLSLCFYGIRRITPVHIGSMIVPPRHMAKIKYHSITSLNTFLLLAPALLYFETVGILSSRKIVESDISGRFEGSSPRRSSRCKPHPAPRRNKQPYRTGSP